MKALLIGGTRFIGHHLTERLLAGGHEVTLLHRGKTPSAFAGRVREVLGDRADAATWKGLRGSWDLVVDLCAYLEADTRAAADALKGRVGRFVHVSTGQVYLVLDPVPIPAREEDFDGRPMAAPSEPADREAWEYGMGKRACEEALFELSAGGFPATSLRLPVVQGPRDAKLRLRPYVRRILAGEAVELGAADAKPIRYLFVRDFADCVASLAGSRAGLGRAYNLAMDDDDVTLEVFIAELFRALGREPRIETRHEATSPLSGSWVSFLDPSRAKAELGFRPTPWREWLRETASWYAAELA